MPSPHDLPRHARTAATMVLVMTVAGCGRPLAVQDEFFSPFGETVSVTSERIGHTVRHQRALHAARRACAFGVHASIARGRVEPAAGPDPGTTAARDALAQLCAAPAWSPAPALGGISNAYRRWVEDRVRELPEVSETAIGAAGGS